MKKKRNITEGEAKLLAAILLVIAIAIITGIMAIGLGASFGEWVGMFISLLAGIVILILIMSYK